MKKNMWIKVLLLVTIALFSTSSAINVNASKNDVQGFSYELLYQQAINAGALDPKTKTYTEWLNENENEFYPLFSSGKASGELDNSITYEYWLQYNNYGQEPKDNIDFETFDATSRAYKVKPGDIFITNSTASSLFLGHAAIATGTNSILDMPGLNVGDKNNNNRQLTWAQWKKAYSKGWIKVHRMKDSKMAAKVAKYADRNYYSSTGSATKNIKIPYGIDSHRYQKSPNYCSKLVWQAYYYGSGDAKVVVPGSGIISPYALPNVTFYKEYGISVVQQY
ncbi:hypothetical protein [Brochothrix thermosphacta]|uniref:hypothetical protein n=1 Tax=Brochothrix thermosphacta TaxID=2756 RepID=UPI001C4E6409|nr:hypothetical protein [Brochothrix thermosphacta]